LTEIPNHKFQNPNKSQAPISNDRKNPVSNLVIGAYLGFGAWNLVIAALKASQSQISLMGLRSSCGFVKADQAAFVINPERRHREQTFIRTVLPSLTVLILWRLGYQTFRVLLWAWLTLWPKTGPFPQISQTFAIGEPQE
jgi:hypothetical protein